VCVCTLYFKEPLPPYAWRTSHHAHARSMRAMRAPPDTASARSTNDGPSRSMRFSRPRSCTTWSTRPPAPVWRPTGSYLNALIKFQCGIKMSYCRRRQLLRHTRRTPVKQSFTPQTVWLCEMSRLTAVRCSSPPKCTRRFQIPMGVDPLFKFRARQTGGHHKPCQASIKFWLAVITEKFKKQVQAVFPA
jgi:hypothetical protein